MGEGNARLLFAKEVAEPGPPLSIADVHVKEVALSVVEVVSNPILVKAPLGCKLSMVEFRCAVHGYPQLANLVAWIGVFGEVLPAALQPFVQWPECVNELGTGDHHIQKFKTH
jgi:hypothetical protein